MDFKGHDMYKIGDAWVFDLTLCTGYLVNINKEDGKDAIVSYTPGFNIKYKIEANKQGCDVEYLGIEVPFGVVRKACNIVNIYYREAGLDGKCGKSNRSAEKI